MVSILTATSGTAEIAGPGARARLAVSALAVVGGSLAIVGAAAPWLSFFAGLQPVTGLDGLNGRVAAGFGGAGIAVALLFLATGRAGFRWLLGLIGFGILAIAGWSGITLVSTLAQLQADPLLVAQAGPGVPILAIGGALAFATMFVPMPQGEGTGLTVSAASLRAPIAATLAIAGLVHLAIGPEHLAESIVLGGSMIAAGVAQLILAVIILRGGEKAWPLVLTVVLSAVFVATYVVAVTVGLPIVDAGVGAGMEAMAGDAPGQHVDGVTPMGLATQVLQIAGAFLAAATLAIRHSAARDARALTER